MAKKFNLGDKVTHDFSGGVGTVVGLRIREPYTVRVKWEGDPRIEKEWYKPEVLRLATLRAEDIDTRLFDYLVVARSAEGEGRRELEKLFPVYKDLEAYVEKLEKEAYDEGYANCQDTYGDGPSS